MNRYENKFEEEIQKLKEGFIKTTNKLLVDVKRHNTIMAQSDKRQLQEHDQLLNKLTEVKVLNNELEDTQKEILLILGGIAEVHSKETSSHVARVAGYSYLIAKLLGLEDEQCNILRDASPMHDIGKIAVPDAILNKPAKLSDEEFVIMKGHAVLGYEMLKSSKRELMQAAAIVTHEHHERYDGKGYPRGLEAEDIHIFGRITCFADVMDALSSKRCYKEAWSDKKVFEYLKAGSGTQFDPKIVNVFMQNIEEFLEIRSLNAN